MAEGENISKAQRAPTPEEYLENLHADLSSSAASKEAEANDLENRMTFLRVEAAGLRHAAVGVREALDLFHREMARAKEFINVRDGKDKPARDYDAEVPSKSGYEVRIPSEYR